MIDRDYEEVGRAARDYGYGNIRVREFFRELHSEIYNTRWLPRTPAAYMQPSATETPEATVAHLPWEPTHVLLNPAMVDVLRMYQNGTSPFHYPLDRAQVATLFGLPIALSDDIRVWRFNTVMGLRK